MILLTGATGYIGSHIWVELIKASFQVIGFDNFSNSSSACLRAIEVSSGKAPQFIEGDIRDVEKLTNIFDEDPISHVVHLAALKDISESMIKCDEYYDVNVRGLHNVFRVMRLHKCFKIIFSSSAAVYGEKAFSPITETSITAPSNVYGMTKLAAEKLISDEFNQTPKMRSVSLRYFNVAGRHSSGLLQDLSLSKASSLFSEIERTILDKNIKLLVFGDDWGTKDGTCIRDYVHIADLVKGHIDALNLLDRCDECIVLNLGLGVGQSVYDVVLSYEHIIGRPIPMKVTSRRVGDVPVSFADINLATQLIRWKPQKTLSDMCMDSFSVLYKVRK